MERSEDYNRWGALILGVLQIAIGVVLAGLQVGMLLEDLIPGHSGVGFWAGSLIILTGSLQVASFGANVKCLIIIVMILCILTALVCALGSFIAGIMLVIGSFTGASVEYAGASYKYKLQEDLTNPQIALLLCDGVLAIMGSVFCCIGVCSTRNTQQPMVLAYITPVQNGQHMVNVD